MYLQIHQQTLANALKAVVGIVENKNSQPIMGNVSLSLEDNHLELTTSDSQIWLSYHVGLDDTHADDSVTIPAKKMLQIVQSLPKQEITIDTEQQGAIIRCGRGRFTLATLPANDFPMLPPPSAITLKITQRKLRELITQTIFCAAVADVRYYLNGLLFDFSADKMSVVATDGHRLALSIHDGQMIEDGAPMQVIVPRKAVAELMRSLALSDDPVIVTLDQTAARFEFGEHTLITKLIDGRFPDYHGVLPHDPPLVMTAACEPLKQALARVAILSNEKYKGVRLTIRPGTLLVSARNPEQEEAEEEMEVEYDGEPFEIGFNVVYLTEALSAVQTEEVELCFSDPNSSCLVKPRDNDQQKYVVMPIRL